MRPEWLEECDREGRRLEEAEFAVQGARSSGRLRSRQSSNTDGTAADMADAGPGMAPQANRAVASTVAPAARAVAASAAAVSLSMPDPAVSVDESVDSGEETEDLADTDKFNTGTACISNQDAPLAAKRGQSDDARDDGCVSDSTEQLDDAEVTRMHASYCGDSLDPRGTESGDSRRWSCAGLAGRREGARGRGARGRGASSSP